jgi:hypothetical protein
MGQFKIPEAINDRPDRHRDSIGIRIVFTHEIQDVVLLGGMAAGISWFQSVHPAHYQPLVKRFCKKKWGIFEKQESEALKFQG